jgi:hypothetical protein
MLFEFYQEELEKQNLKKKEGNNNNSSIPGIQALFYISGFKSSKSGGRKGEGEQLSFSSTVCRDDQLESVKESFTQISSVHIYSLQRQELEKESVIDQLTRAIQETTLMTDDEGRSSVE